MTYKELLVSEEWFSKREYILKRDKKKCQHCLNKYLFSNCKKGYSFEKVDKHLVLNLFDSDDETIIKEYFNVAQIDHGIKVYFDFIDNRNIILGIRKLTTEESVVYKLDYKRRILKAITKISDLENIVIKDSTRNLLLKVYKDDLFNKGIENFYNSTFKEIEEDIINQELHFYIIRGLHVHHKYYQANKMPWEYPDEALITLCLYCHNQLHTKSKVPYLDEHGNQLSLLTPCSRCKAIGYFPEYKHVNNGICFRCEGARYEELIK